MKNEKTKSKAGLKASKNAAQTTNEVSADFFSIELSAPCWSVITFELCAAKNLSYDEAAKKLQELNRRGISGLCIVTDEAGERVNSKL